VPTAIRCARCTGLSTRVGCCIRPGCGLARIDREASTSSAICIHRGAPQNQRRWSSRTQDKSKTDRLNTALASSLAVGPANRPADGDSWGHIPDLYYLSTKSDASNPDTLHRVVGLPSTRFFWALFPPNDPESW
jgi:hypothetical protein